ncbi:MAG: translation elongation factor P [Candidatus Scalindua rubra]|uniref:Translation elongation factor P n=1 Tax=Candidatus Scalindua rubra TaxID=1872076 RepID=A0A1E3X2Y4_9BACT|nr:MAG: translation elongation factor P [Candidatus Scalindua rubra]
MKKIITKILKYFGYTIQKIAKEDDPFKDVLESSAFEEFFQKTEGMISLEEATLLYELAKNTLDHCIVEVGSYRGRSTVALGRGSLDGGMVPVYAIDPHEEFTGILGGSFGPADRGAFFQTMLATSCYHVVRLINLSSEQLSPNWNQKISLLWIDGDHSYEGVKRDFDCWLPHLTLGTFIAFDDSKDPKLGPYRLIEELLETGKFDKVREVGKISVLKFVY